MTNQEHTVLYTGVTNNLERRILEQRSGNGGYFSNKYKLYNLVYFEESDEIKQAILREKQIKGGSREDKIKLVNSINPEWKDLYEEYFNGR